jgi:hypothetical protein
MQPDSVSVRDRNNNHPLSDAWSSVPVALLDNGHVSHSEADDDEFEDAKEDFYDM